jgi:hypothetical protein
VEALYPKVLSVGVRYFYGRHAFDRPHDRERPRSGFAGFLRPLRESHYSVREDAFCRGQGTTEQLNIVPNNWDAIAERLQTFKVLSRGDGSIG